MALGDTIKKMRRLRHMSVDTLAELIGKNKATIYRYENNDIENIPATTLAKIASALDIDITTLMPNTQNHYDEKVMEKPWGRMIVLFREWVYRLSQRFETEEPFQIFLLKVIEADSHTIEQLSEYLDFLNYKQRQYENSVRRR